MRVSRRHRGWLCGLLGAVLLFAQLASAAYACPQWAPDRPASGAEMAAAMAPDCSEHAAAGMDPDQPQLCKAHCESGQTSANSQSVVPDVQAPALGAALIRVVEPIDATVPAAARDALAPGPPNGPPIGWPPVYLSFLVLRD